jgi:hypothetical protein
MDSPDGTRDQMVALLRRWAPAFLQGGVDAIADAAQWFSLPGGNTLFRRGDLSDAIYVVLSGVLGISIEIATGAEQLVGRLGPGRNRRRNGLHHRRDAIRDREAGYRSAMARLAVLSRKKPDEVSQAPTTLQL